MLRHPDTLDEQAKLKAQKKTERYTHFLNTIVPAFPLFHVGKL